MAKKKKELKKLFISQPMRGLSDEEILAERERIIKYVKDSHKNDEIEVIESFITSTQDPDVKSIPIYYLGRSLQFLADADIVFLAKGWEKTKGCLIERAVSRSYEVPEVIEEVEDENGEIVVNQYITPVYE